MATPLQTVRKTLGYSAARVLDDLIRRADRRNIPIMGPASLKTKMSRWENGHELPSEPYRRLFREVYGRTNAELGFPDERDADPEADELRARLATARAVDHETVQVFLRQVNDARQVDRRFGGVTLLDQLRSHIDHVTLLLSHAAPGGTRDTLAAGLTEASTLAGWQALDRNAVGQAWRHYECAKTASREAGSAALLAHATAEQALVLTDLGETAAAVEQLAHARQLIDRRTPLLLRAWLAAAHGEGLAAAGRRDDALRAFDTAAALRPVETADPAVPYLFLGDPHLDRWRAHALARLGDTHAIDGLTEALTRLPDSFTRARVGLLVDLAFALAAAGDRDACLDRARQARRLATQIKSDRHQRRLSSLVLPGGPVAPAA